MSEDAVRTVLQEYTDATRARSVERMRAIFHDGAVMSGYLGPDLLVGSPQPFYDFLTANEVGDDYASEVTKVAVTGATAWGRVAERNLFGMSFENDFHLVRTPAGDWRIVSKLFHADPG